MPDRLDRLVRDTVHDLADGADIITDRDRRRLALHATEHAHTLRLRRRGAVAGVVALVAALAVGLPYGMRFLGTLTDTTVTLPGGVLPVDGVTTHVIDDTSRPIELIDGWYVIGNRLVLNPETMTYTHFGAQMVAPSPDGRWVVTDTAQNAYRVHDVLRGTSRLYRYDSIAWDSSATSLSLTGWSPDGNKFVFAQWFEVDRGLLNGVPYQGGALAVHMIEPGSPRDEEKATWLFTLPTNDLGCEHCVVEWLPSGDLGIAVPAGIQTVSLTGELGRVLPVKGIPAGLDAWSPDGRSVIVQGGEADPGTGWAAMQLVDVATGAVIRQWSDMHLVVAQWIDNDRFLSWEGIPTDSDSLEWRAIASLWTTDGTLLERWIPPLEVVTMPMVAARLAAHLG